MTVHGGRTAVVTLASAARRSHLEVQQRVLAARASSDSDDVGTDGPLRLVAWLDDDVPPGLAGPAPAGSVPADSAPSDSAPSDSAPSGPTFSMPLPDAVVSVPPGEKGLRLAAARNAAADRAIGLGADLVVFLDADCVPGPTMLARYASAAAEQPDAVLCGPVTYLPPGVDAADDARLLEHRAPHPARPDPRDGELLVAEPGDYPLFWSLSFAVTAERWRAGPRFDERYEGYGGEDTDFAFALRDAGVPLVWVGGADAYHQHHPTSSPPVEHLDDIVRNGALFASRWGQWPMGGWFDAFAARGLVTRTADDGWQRVAS